MKLKTISIILLSGTIQFCLNAQTSEHITQINHDVWNKFYHAFDSLDHRIMAKIHSRDLIRIPANRHQILDFDTYIENYKSSFERNRENKTSLKISLRFTERIANDSIASERGIYQLVIHRHRSERQTYYGKFHVLLKREYNSWKIFMDYDSNENNTIGVDDYNKAFALDDLSNFPK